MISKLVTLIAFYVIQSVVGAFKPTPAKTPVYNATIVDGFVTFSHPGAQPIQLSNGMTSSSIQVDKFLISNLLLNFYMILLFA